MRQLSFFKLKLRGSSISETIIAMALIAIGLAVGTMVYSRIMVSGVSLESAVIEQKIKELAWQTEWNTILENEDFDFDGYTVEKRVSHPNIDGVVQVVFTAFGAHCKYTYKTLIRR